MMEKPNAPRVSLRAVSKTFRVGCGRGETALARLAGLFSGRAHTRSLVAVDDVSLEVAPGEVVGVIGRNGSGKSTLLRLAAGIYEPDAGTVTTRGDVMYIGGFSHETKPRLTVRENVVLSSAISGLSPAEAEASLGPILEFSGLREYADTKVYQLSAGMALRLNFSVFIHTVEARSPDTIILDEVLSAAGDLEFKDRALPKIHELVRRGAAVLFASHNLADIERHCQRALWVERGAIVADGSPAEVVGRYRAAIGTKAPPRGNVAGA